MGAPWADPVATLIVVFAALVAEGILGGLPGVRSLLETPRAMVGALAGWFDEKLNRRARGRGALRMRGALVALVVVLVSGAAGAGLQLAARQGPHGWIVVFSALLFLLGQRRPIDAMRRVLAALRAGETARAATAAAGLVRFDVFGDDLHGIARATVQGGTIRVVDGVLASLFWFLLLGLPALCVFAGLAAAADVIGRRSPRHIDFGFAVARLQDVLALPGAVLAGPLLCIAALFCPAANPARAFSGWLGDLGARGLAAGYRGEGAIAGAFRLSLGGPLQFDGEVIAGRWIGDGRARAETGDVQKAIFLLSIACLLVALAVAVSLVLSSG